MAYDVHVSFSKDEAVLVQNFFNKNPDVVPSKMMRRLLIEHIKKTSPDLVTVEDIKPEKKHTMADYATALKAEVVRCGKIGKDRVPPILVEACGVNTKRAEEIWRALDKLLGRYGMKNEYGWIKLTGTADALAEG
jgi:hypothetical protein